MHTDASCSLVNMSLDLCFYRKGETSQLNPVIPPCASNVFYNSRIKPPPVILRDDVYQLPLGLKRK